MSKDDDILTAPIPEPDAEASAAERAHAKAFADLVDKALAGRAMPPAMSADDRALLEVATVIRAAGGEGVQLGATKRGSIVEDALRLAVGGQASTSLPGSSVTPITSARRRRAPWVIASASSLVAAAALLLLWMRPAPRVEAPAQPSAPTAWRSRPTDALVGEIKATPNAVAATTDAVSRIDTIFADRLDGYRDRRLSGGKP